MRDLKKGESFLVGEIRKGFTEKRILELGLEGKKISADIGENVSKYSKV